MDKIARDKHAKRKQLKRFLRKDAAYYNFCEVINELLAGQQLTSLKVKSVKKSEIYIETPVYTLIFNMETGVSDMIGREVSE